MDEKRKAGRDDVCLPGRLLLDSRTYVATVRNLSADGALFTLEDRLEAEALMGAEGRFEMVPQENAVYAYEGRIVRVFELDDGALGVAMNFSSAEGQG